MAFDEELAARVQAVLADEPGLSDRRMFGGVAFLIVSYARSLPPRS